MRVRLNIELVAVEGLNLEPHQEPALREALTDALADFFAREESFEPGIHAQLAARLPEPAGRGPESLGRGIGRAIHGSVPRHAQ